MGTMDLASLPVDYLFDVPLDAAAVITGFRHNKGKGKGAAYREVTTLEPINGNALRRLSKPPKWRQTVGSIEYWVREKSAASVTGQRRIQP
jgi:hypothetical protein